MGADLQQMIPSWGEAALAQCALGAQGAICCCGTHGEQLASAHFGEVEMLMPLQWLDERREKGDEPFGANPVRWVPHQEQRLLDFRS